MKKKVIRIISFGGLGDVLLSTPIFGALKRKYPNSRIIVYCIRKIDREIYRNNPHIDELRSSSFFVNPIAYTKYYFKLTKFHWLNYPNYSPSLTYEKSAARIIADMVDAELEDPRLEVYLTNEEDKRGKAKLAPFPNPIAIHITSSTSDNQNWPLKNWEELVKSMPQYTFIQLGLSGEDKVEGAVDFRGTTSFREALSILKNSMSFVGVVSSFAHATSAVATPGVVLFGPSSPQVWGHANNINLYKDLRCAPCIDHLQSSPCPYGKPCLTTITVEEVRDALLSQLATRGVKGPVGLNSRDRFVP